MKPIRITVAALVFVALMAQLAIAFRHTGAPFPFHLGFPRVFATFVLLLAPLWFCGFRAVEPLKRLSPPAQVASAGALAVPYFVFAAGTPEFYWRAALIVIALPVLLAAFLRFSDLGALTSWRDAAALVIISTAYFLKWLQSAWPYASLALFPKLFLANVALYCFIVIRRVDAGYSLAPSRSALLIGIREFGLYFPFALVLGEAIGFIRFHAIVPDWHRAIAVLLATFLLIALPEELFFRGILQSLLESRLGRNGALVLASVLFGLSHFNHGSVFNWRYVLLASIAGVFYGRAWRANRQILACVVTHTLVDVVWSLWFR